MRETRFDPWVGKITGRRKWQPTLVLWKIPWRSLVGYSPQGHKKSDMTQRIHFTFTTFLLSPSSHLLGFHLPFLSLSGEKGCGHRYLLSLNPELQCLQLSPKAFSPAGFRVAYNTSLPHLLHRLNSTAVILMGPAKLPRSTLHSPKLILRKYHSLLRTLYENGGTRKTWPNATCANQTLCDQCLKLQDHPRLRPKSMGSRDHAGYSCMSP